MKTLISFLIVFSMISCTKENNGQDSAFNIGAQISIKFLNPNGENLFDTTTSGHYNIDNVKMYNIIDNVSVEVDNNSNPVYGNQVELSQNTPYYLYIYSNINTNNGGVLLSDENGVKVYEFNSILELSPTDTDTIKTNIEYRYNNVQLIKIWYNGNLVEPTFEIVKSTSP